MKILGGGRNVPDREHSWLRPGAGTVAIDANERMGRLRQDQFAYESERVLDVVLQGHAEMWTAMRERDVIYALGRSALFGRNALTSASSVSM